jgi:predicted amidophosphoribosyltransferase
MQPSHGKCNNYKNLPTIYVLGPREGLLKTLIHDYKYNSVRALGPEFADLLDQTLPQTLKCATIVPLPTATNHIRSRGLDHTLIIAKHLARHRSCRVQKLLVRAKNTVQVGTDKATRKKQADAAYNLNPRLKIDPKETYILLDDVWTTGASMKSAIKKLQQAGAKNIIVVLLAVSDAS